MTEETKEQETERRKVKRTTWQYNFVYLSCTTQQSLPTLLQQAKLAQAGLGQKAISFIDCSDGDLFHHDLLDHFPKLRYTGGQVMYMYLYL